MNKSIIMLLALMLSIANYAQTLNVVVGATTYCIPAEKAGDMPYTTGSELTIIDKTFPINDIDKIFIDESSVTASSVEVTYNGNSASVRIPYDIMSHLNVAVKGGHVSIVQDDNVTREVTYTL